MKTVGEDCNGREDIELIEQKKPDLVLLDIQLPDIGGFEVIHIVKSPPLIIFVNAYDEYAIRAFEVNAFDYLLKPVSLERFSEVLKKVKDEIERGADFHIKIDALLKSLSDRYLERIAMRAGGR